jgi:hypothetical protein
MAMLIDPFMVTTFVAGAVGIVGWGLYRREVERATVSARYWSQVYGTLSDHHAETAGNLATANQQLAEVATKETARQAQRIDASRKAAAARTARAEQDRKDAPARRAKTLEALKGVKLRSRAQVVAPVKARRNKAKKAAQA